MSFLSSIFGPPDIDKLKSQRDINGLIKALDYNSNKTGIDNDQQTIRCKAAIALGELGDSKAVPPLIKKLDDEYHVSKDAAWALGTIGDQKAVEPLIQYISDLDWKKCGSRGIHVWALGKLGDKKAVDSLIHLLLENHPIDTKNAIWALSPKECAAWALGILGDKKAIDPLKSIFCQPIPYGRYDDGYGEFYDMKRDVARALIRLGVNGNVLCETCTYTKDTGEKECNSKFRLNESHISCMWTRNYGISFRK
jgi:HEAT repeat protein